MNDQTRPRFSDDGAQEPAPGFAPRTITVLAVHPPSLAATRLRAVQYSDALADAGLHLNLWSFLREQDLNDWYGPSHLRRALVTVRGLLRMVLVVGHVRRASVVIVQREAMPLGPPIVELLTARFRPLVWDLDDALWEEYVSPTAGRVPRWLRATGHKFERLCRCADEVWAGSEILAAWCRERNANVHVVPTVVPVPDILGTPPLERTVGWIGTHSTAEFVETILPALADVVPRPSVHLVGARLSPPAVLDVAMEPWSPSAELRTLAETRVGVYPIDVTHPLAEGKCGLKAILYMANGIPSVVTPTTTNASIVRHGIDGFHARDLAEWTTAVQRLLDDDALWQQCREAAHSRAHQSFSLQVWAPRMVARLNQLLGRACP